ncbi:MAG: threonine synthase [Peptostreptococcaceae bacterium]|nr:threonine synthase [Peptostreptococcaceae bacterium]MDY5739806.1 threonine synthase [Anaerovoracaceae bacterium]
MNKYISTRGTKEALTGSQAIIKGIATDKGLYVPESIPPLPFTIEEAVGKSYQEIAFDIIHSFFDDFTDEEMEACIKGAYDEKFRNKKIAPITQAGSAYFLELYHGKTAAFKDMALSILPYLLTTSMKKENEDKKICILTATSGDTGKAALEGFADVPGTEIIVFYPKNGVSQVQERQMISQTGENTHVIAIEGNFDDAQTGVKKIFADDSFAEKLSAENIKLSSANSINIGRLVPQVAYYVYAYVKLIEDGALEVGKPMNVVVPTGNFGNILAAFYAKEMGVPIKRFICASNENKVLTDFISTGVYDINREFYLTNSPSMDILISSNLERLLYHLSNGQEVEALMAALEAEKKYKVNDQIMEKMADFRGGYCTVEDTQKTIFSLYRKHGYLVDTHTAVAYKVYEDYKKATCDETPTVIASTASPYKFAESVASAIMIDAGEDGFSAVKALNEATGVPVPYGLVDLDKKPINHTKVIKKEEMPEAIEEIFA